MELETLVALGVSLGLGLLVGLQRERVEVEVAGIRTFALITVLGAIVGVAGRDEPAWLVGAAALGLALLLVMGNLPTILQREQSYGVTTEVAALVMFFVGVIVSQGLLAEGVVVGGATALLLYWRAPLHDAVRRLDEADVTALMRLALLGLVILPALPNRSFGPYDVLNPFEIWTMVVLIVGISMGAYVAYRLFGPSAGSVAAGILGGLISSTALTASYARRSSERRGESAAAAVAILVASAVVFPRVLAEIAIVAPRVLPSLGPPVALMGVVVAAIAAGSYYLAGRRIDDLEPDTDPPSDLKSPILFGALYAAVILGAAAARDNFGQQGLYVVGAISGLADVDAITLSTARLVSGGGLDPSTGWRIIIVGALSNMFFKALAIAVLGTRSLLVKVAVAYGIAAVVALALLFLWP